MNRLRLSGAYVAVMLAGLLLFAAVAVFTIDRVERSTLDARLRGAAHAAIAIIDVSHHQIRIDSDDRRQFLTILGTDADGAVLDTSGAVLLSSVARVPPVITARKRSETGFFNAGSGDSALRVYSLRLSHDGTLLGTLLVWRGSDWIAESDQNVALALALTAFVIAALALIAGNYVTRRALDDAFARQRRFTADASHELRAPLAVIRAEADLALRKEREAVEYRSAMETIALESDRMESIIGDLLSAARIERGARERVELDAVVTDIAERLSSAAAAKDARFELQLETDASILADRQVLERAILAIAHNAVKYTPKHGIISMQVQKNARTVQIAIGDQGPGFSEEALAHALERFWRGDSARPYDGTGLGLAIAKSIVETFGGQIALENTPAGAAVRLRFPAA